MSAELAKAYDPAAVQTEVQAVWDAEKSFHADPSDPGEPYSIVIPPPNVTAALHLGHALNNTIQDILIRHARMQGKNAVWLPGTDHAGIATQTVVEKRVLKEEGRRRTDFERDEFVKKIQAWKDEYEQVILGQLKAMGCSCDWDRTAFTMDEPRARAVREAFFQLFKDGLIYRGKRLVNWDPVTLTALADDEVENEEVDGFFYYLKYPVCDADGKTSGETITVATTRPETMLGDSAVAINPTDPRSAALRGKFVKLPIVDRVIPIIEDDYVVKPVQYGGDPADTKAQMATGFLKVTPAHDPNDYEIGQRHNLPIINVMAPDASISLDHGWSAQEPHQSQNATLKPLVGLAREIARKQVVKYFKEQGLLEDQKPYRHTVGHSYRSHVAIEPYLSDQWYLKVKDDKLAGAALRAMNPQQRGGTGFQPVSASSKTEDNGLKTHATKDAVTFYPERYAKSYQTWNENIRDWCISRQLWWGHRIPVWSYECSEQTKAFLRHEGGRIEPADSDAQDALYVLATEYPGRVSLADDNRIRMSDAPSGGGTAAFIKWPSSGTFHVCVREGDEIESRLEAAGFRRDSDVLDTWFSSGLWPMSTLGWPLATEVARPGVGAGSASESASLQKWNPTSVLCTAREIITLWVSRMVMFNEYFRGCVPFKDVFIHAMIQDGEGRKMSKSLGNGVDPLDIISSHGADAMRFTLASMTTHTQDVRMPVEKDPETGKNTSPKFDLGRNFANKLWNAARFAFSQIGTEAQRHEGTKGEDLSVLDRWLLSRLSRTITEIDAAIGEYRFDQYAKSAYDFFWRDLCDWYVEAAKVQFKDEAKKATTAHVIASALDAALRLMHPMIPFVTEKLWWTLNEVYPDRGIDGWVNRAVVARIDRKSDDIAPRIIGAQWPVAGKIDEAAEAVMADLQALIVGIRTARSDYKVNPKQSVTVTIVAPEHDAAQITAHREMVESLATCKIAGAVSTLAAAPANSTKITVGACEVHIEGLVDEAAEQQRNAKRRDELTKQIAAMKGRLTNQGYIAKAPPHLVKQTQDQLAEAEAELAKL